MFSSSRILVTSSMFFCVSSFNDEIGAELEASSSAVDVCAVVDTGVVDGENVVVDTTVVIGAVVVAGPAVVGGAVVDVISAFDVRSADVGGALGDAVVAAAVDVDHIIVVISATDVGGAVVVGDVVVGAVVVGAVVVGAVVDVVAAADVAVAADVDTPVVVSAADDIGTAAVDGDAACVVCAGTGIDDAVAVDVRASIVAVKSVTNEPVDDAESVVAMSGQTSEIVDPKLPIMPRCVVLNCS